MSVPKSVVKLKRNGVEYVSSVERTNYTITELTRAAMRDVGKLLCRRTNEKAQKLPGMKRSKRVRGKSSAFQYWARKKSAIYCLDVNTAHGTESSRNWEQRTSQRELSCTIQPWRT